MRILFDSCVYDLRNKGNVAMLQTAVNRIHDLWPEATLEVITSAPYLLRLYCPDARPISPTGVDYWSEQHGFFQVALRKMPVSLLRFILEIREAAWQRSNQKKLALAGSPTEAREDMNQAALQVATTTDETGPYSSFDPEVLKEMDLYVATGGHYLTDVMNYDLLAVLDRMDLTTQVGIPTVMVGQGIGPIHDARLLSRAKVVLPKVDLFLVREGLEAPGILSQIGVDPSRVFVTSDDAVELAYQVAPQKTGAHIGVGFRVAHTTEANARHMEVLRKVLQQASTKYKCRLVGLPVSQSAHELDQAIIESLSAGSQSRRSFLQRLSSPERIISDTALCRVVVTGTYHTAVFALAQGIPVIGLVKSASYMNKFMGLADQYKVGMTVFQLDDEFLFEKVLAAIDSAWESAVSVRAKLLEIAGNQVESGRTGYKLIHEVKKGKIKDQRLLT